MSADELLQAGSHGSSGVRWTALHIQQKASELTDRIRKHCSSHSQSPLTWRRAALGIGCPDGILQAMSSLDQGESSWRHVGDMPLAKQAIDHAKTSVICWMVW